MASGSIHGFAAYRIISLTCLFYVLYYFCLFFFLIIILPILLWLEVCPRLGTSLELGGADSCGCGTAQARSVASSDWRRRSWLSQQRVSVVFAPQRFLMGNLEMIYSVPLTNVSSSNAHSCFLYPLASSWDSFSSLLSENRSLVETLRILSLNSREIWLLHMPWRGTHWLCLSSVEFYWVRVCVVDSFHFLVCSSISYFSSFQQVSGKDGKPIFFS